MLSEEPVAVLLDKARRRAEKTARHLPSGGFFTSRPRFKVPSPHRNCDMSFSDGGHPFRNGLSHPYSLAAVKLSAWPPAPPTARTGAPPPTATRGGARAH